MLCRNYFNSDIEYKAIFLTYRKNQNLLKLTWDTDSQVCFALFSQLWGRLYWATMIVVINCWSTWTRHPPWMVLVSFSCAGWIFMRLSAALSSQEKLPQILKFKHYREIAANPKIQTTPTSFPGLSPLVVKSHVRVHFIYILIISSHLTLGPPVGQLLRTGKVADSACSEW